MLIFSGLSNNNMDIENNINSNLSFVNKQLEPKVINMIQPKQIKPKLLINNINGKNVIVTKPFIFKSEYIRILLMKRVCWLLIV